MYLLGYRRVVAGDFFWLSYLSDQLTEASELAQEKQQETERDGADVGLPHPAAVTCSVG